jgi:23S rRNA pseudouridine1911/1915/1917 synthase
VAERIELHADAPGQRVDRFLAERTQLSRSAIQRLARDGRVTVNGAAVEPAYKVRAGEALVVDVPDAEPALSLLGEDIPVDVLYEDDDVLVVNKPAGLVVHPAHGHPTGTLVNAVVGKITSDTGRAAARPGIVHRLDKDTSGVMIIAKNDVAQLALARQLQGRRFEKEYLALVWGEVMAGRRIDAPIGRDPVNRKKMSAAATGKSLRDSNRVRRSREAVTRVVAAEHFGRMLTLAQVAIHTGRTHQIRVHLSAIGHPVVGDPLYGGVHRRVPGDLRAVTHLDRPFLHAARLAFTHPTDGRRMAFESPLPADLQHVLDELREHFDQ